MRCRFAELRDQGNSVARNLRAAPIRVADVVSIHRSVRRQSVALEPTHRGCKRWHSATPIHPRATVVLQTAAIRPRHAFSEIDRFLSTERASSNVTDDVDLAFKIE